MTTAEASGTLTVLFTDLVGSTDLMDRLGDVEFDRLRNEHFSRLRAAVDAHGGREVKNTGDGILVTFSSTVEALGCAVDMQRATDAHGRTAGVPLSVRVGLSAGEVTFQAGDVFGRPVVEAARLVAEGAGGQILASAVIGVLAGSRAPTAVTPLGTRELKGLSEPVNVCSVAWEPLSAAALVPLPSMLVDVGRFFVARSREQERLRQLWKAAAAGERRLALLGGEPGIGKTHLAAHVAASVHADGALVLAGRCDEDLGVPYQPFVECLRYYTHLAETPRLGRYPGELARFVPELTELVPGLPAPLQSDPDTERYRLFDAVASWLADLSRETPVLLVLDDLQWGAKPTLLLLRHLLHFAEPLRLLIVATYRDTDVGRNHPLSDLLADLRREKGVERFPLSGLDAAETVSFLEASSGHSLVDDHSVAFARAIHEETEGNPFFVREVIRHLSETGGIAQRDGRWSTTVEIEDLGIPEGVRDVVGRRLNRLSDAANRVLADASVIGVEFDLSLLGAFCGLDDDDLLVALEEAAASRLVTEISDARPRYRFAHGLIRATLYDELSAGRRTRLHRQVAEALEALHAGNLGDHLTALAHHYGRAAAPAAETTKAVSYASQAGEQALAQLAHDEAAAWYQRALDLLDAGNARDAASRLELLLALGEAQKRAGDPAHRETLLLAARHADAVGDVGALVHAALTNNRGMVFNTALGVDDERVAVLELALERLGDVESAERARLLAQLGLELAWSPERGRRLRCSDEAMAIARGHNDVPLLTAVMLPRFYTIWSPETLPERWADSAALMDLTEAGEDPVLRFRAAWLRFRAALEVGDAAEARRTHEIIERLDEDLGQPVLRWLTGWTDTGLTYLAGRITEAVALAFATRDIGRSLALVDADHVFLTHHTCLALSGEPVPSMFEMAQQSFESSGSALHRAQLAFAHCQEGKPEEAQATLEPFVRSGFSDVSGDVSWMANIITCAHVAWETRYVEASEVLLGVLGPFAHQMATGAGMPHGSVADFVGRLAMVVGDFERADDAFATAEQMHASMGAPAFLANTQLEWARMLIRRARPADRERVRSLLGQAAEAAAELSLSGLAARTATLAEGL